MILLLGGTTEAKQVAGSLEQAGLDYIYSTRTEVDFEGKGKYRFGSLDTEGLKSFCTVNEISHIIDACHPFAKELHAAVATIAHQIPVIRFEREFSARITNPLVHYVSDYTEALIQIKKEGYTSMLALTGVQSIPHLQSFWQNYPCWFRILDRPYSINFAARYDFPADFILFGLPQEKNEEIELFSRLNPAVIVTKESGLNGKLDTKTAAAVNCKIPIFIIKKPVLSAFFKMAYHLPELLAMLQ